MPPRQLYDDDDLVDDYDDEDDELSPEDRDAMANGASQVRKALGEDAAKVTTAQIQDALWHYYYDVDKSVAYLTKTFLSPTPKRTAKKSPDGKSGPFRFCSERNLFVRRTSGADQEELLAQGRRRLDALPPRRRSSPLAVSNPWPSNPRASYNLRAEFADMPWLNVPQCRLSLLLPPPTPRGGLLGGGDGPPKMSKLQALAAARRKKNAEMDVESRSHVQNETGLKRLSLLDEAPGQESMMPSSSSAKRQKNSTAGQLHSQVVGKNSSQLPLPSTGDQGVDEATILAPEALPTARAAPLLSKARPSAFAKTLFRSAPDAPPAGGLAVFSMPYASSPSFHAAAFAEPSPDDVVLAAQAKGSQREKAH